MSADPTTRRLLSFDLLDDAEHDELDEWGNRAALTESVPAGVSIPELFAAQVARAPEAVAIRFKGRSLSYGDLDVESNRLAHLLAGHGVGPGECVAVLFPRCADGIVAMLAVLKCGAAYVPIDPAHSGARLDFVLADAAPSAVITSAELRPRLEGRDLWVVEATTCA